MGRSIAGGRSRTVSLRRQIILARPGEGFGSKRALIVRWIGVRSRRDASTSVLNTPEMGRVDNVIALKWSETFGRPAIRRTTPGDAPADILTMDRYSDAVTVEADAVVRRA